MSNLEHIQGLMAEAGAAMELSAVVEDEDGASWFLGVDEGLEVIVEYDAEEDRLILSGEAAAPPQDRRLQTYELLMLYNAHWRDTGGIRMVLEAPEGPVSQIAEIAAEGLDAASLQDALGNFIAKLRIWRLAISEGTGLDQTRSDGPEGESPWPEAGALRV